MTVYIRRAIKYYSYYMFHRYLQKILIDDTKVWSCIDNCDAECCGTVPIPSQTYRIFKRKIKKPIKEVMKLRGNAVLITEDYSCVFLDNNHKCSIYGHRPEICKLYGTIEELQCPYVDVHGYKRTEDDVIKTKELIRLQDKVRMDMIK